MIWLLLTLKWSVWLQRTIIGKSQEVRCIEVRLYFKVMWTYLLLFSVELYDMAILHKIQNVSNCFFVSLVRQGCKNYPPPPTSIVHCFFQLVQFSSIRTVGLYLQNNPKPPPPHQWYTVSFSWCSSHPYKLYTWIMILSPPPPSMIHCFFQLVQFSSIQRVYLHNDPKPPPPPLPINSVPFFSD